MSGLLSTLNAESIDVPALERIYAANRANDDLAADAIGAMEQLDPELAWRAVWILKRLALDGRLTETDLVRIAESAEGITHWAARLDLCQLFAATGCPESARDALHPFLVECFANRRPMIRAWAISVLLGFRSDARLRKQIDAMIRKAKADPAASVRARLRQLGLTATVKKRKTKS